MDEKHKVMDEVVRDPWPAWERCVDGICRRWLRWEAAGKGHGGSRLWSRAAGRARQRAAEAKIQAGGDGWSMERSWGARRAGFGRSPAGKGSACQRERSKGAQAMAFVRLGRREGKCRAFLLK